MHIHTAVDKTYIVYMWLVSHARQVKVDDPDKKG
jgi:hypothetical protein